MVLLHRRTSSLYAVNGLCAFYVDNLSSIIFHIRTHCNAIIVGDASKGFRRAEGLIRTTIWNILFFYNNIQLWVIVNPSSNYCCIMKKCVFNHSKFMLMQLLLVINFMCAHCPYMPYCWVDGIRKILHIHPYADKLWMDFTCISFIIYLLAWPRHPLIT